MAVGRALEAASVGRAALEPLEQAVGEFARSYPSPAPTVLARPVLEHLRDVTRLLDGPLPVARRQRLAVVAGHLAGLAGSLAFDPRDEDLACRDPQPIQARLFSDALVENDLGGCTDCGQPATKLLVGGAGRPDTSLCEACEYRRDLAATGGRDYANEERARWASRPSRSLSCARPGPVASSVLSSPLSPRARRSSPRRRQ